MVDLYAVLGVSRDADLGAIRRAFRRRVRSCHPDGGGSLEAFNELKTAYDVLSNSTRRRRYDETGQVHDKTSVDPRHTKLVEILFEGLDQALLKMNPLQSGRSDVIALTIDVLLKFKSDADKRKKAFETALEQSRQLSGRFGVAEGDNFMEVVVARRMTACQTQIDVQTERVHVIDEALAILRKTKFEASLQLEGPQVSKSRDDDYPESLSQLLDVHSLARFK